MNAKITINFGEMKGFEAPTGDGPAASLPFDGYVQANLRKFSFGVSESSGNSVATLIFAINDEGVSGTLYASMPVSGTYKNRAGEVRPNTDQLGNLLLSSGQTIEEIQQAISAGQSKDLGEILNVLVSQKAIVNLSVQAEVYQGKEKTKVKGYVTPAFFQEQKSAGTHRRPRAATSAASVSNGASRTVAAAGGDDALAGVL